MISFLCGIKNKKPELIETEHRLGAARGRGGKEQASGWSRSRKKKTISPFFEGLFYVISFNADEALWIEYCYSNFRGKKTKDPRVWEICPQATQWYNHVWTQVYTDPYQWWSKQKDFGANSLRAYETWRISQRYMNKKHIYCISSINKMVSNC